MALHNWLILSIIKAAYSDFHAQKKGTHAGGSGISYKSQNLRSLSDHLAFKKRMQRTIGQHSLAGISDDAVSMVIAGLQQLMLRTLASLRANQTIAPDVEDPPEDCEVAETSLSGEISSTDVIGAFWRRPNVLCEQASPVQHRLVVDQ